MMQRFFIFRLTLTNHFYKLVVSKVMSQYNPYFVFRCQAAKLCSKVMSSDSLLGIEKKNMDFLFIASLFLFPSLYFTNTFTEDIALSELR
jgi:hypothetical protein